MKKYIIISCFALFLLLTENCNVVKYTPEYVFNEDEPQMFIDKQTKDANNGFILYKKYCGPCHGITHNGKDSIPNFSKEQIDDYDLRIQMGMGPTHGKLTELSDKQLNNIMSFLLFRKP